MKVLENTEFKTQAQAIVEGHEAMYLIDILNDKTEPEELKLALLEHLIDRGNKLTVKIRKGEMEVVDISVD